MNDQQSTLEKIAASQGFKAFMKKLAIFAGIVTVVGLVMKLCGMQESEMLLVTGMSTLALVAFGSDNFGTAVSDNALAGCQFDVDCGNFTIDSRHTGFNLVV